MRKSHLLAALTTGLVATGPALGQIRVGGQGGVGVGVGLPRVETPRIDTRVETRTRVESPVEADVRTRTRAQADGDARLVLPDHLVGLRTGLVVRNRAGVRIGTVSRILTSADGSVRSVLVARARGRGHLRLAPETLHVGGGVVTTTAAQVNR